MITRQPITLRAAERLWIRLSIGVLTVAFLVVSIFATAGSTSTQIYLACMLALTVLLLVTLSAFRHAGLARQARSQADGESESIIVLFERASFYEWEASSNPLSIRKGWVIFTRDAVVIRKMDTTEPAATFPRLPTSVEPVGGDLLSRPIARFRFSEGSEFDAVVIREGFGDLTGWSASRIRQLNNELVVQATGLQPGTQSG